MGTQHIHLDMLYAVSYANFPILPLRITQDRRPAKAAKKAKASPVKPADAEEKTQ